MSVSSKKGAESEATEDLLHRLGPIVIRIYIHIHIQEKK